MLSEAPPAWCLAAEAMATGDWWAALLQLQGQTALLSSDRPWMLPTLPSPLCVTLTLTFVQHLYPNWTEKLICKLSFCFSILSALNKTCAVSVPAFISLLAVWIWAEKEPPWLKQGVSALVRPPARVQATNSVTFLVCFCFSLGGKHVC